MPEIQLVGSKRNKRSSRIKVRGIKEIRGSGRKEGSNHSILLTIHSLSPPLSQQPHYRFFLKCQTFHENDQENEQEYLTFAGEGEKGGSL